MFPDDQLLETLRHFPSATHEELARITKKNVATLRKQLAKHAQKGIIRKGYTVIGTIPLLPIRSMISIDFDLGMLRSEEFGYSNQKEFVAFIRGRLLHNPRFEHFSKSISIESVEIVLGGHEDVFMIARFRDQRALGDFVTEVIRYLPGVARTNTASLLERDD